jgi:hypothetical protein
MEKVITECGKCHITFPSMELATLHLIQQHSKIEACTGCRTAKILTINLREGCNRCPAGHQYETMINISKELGKTPVVDPLWNITLNDNDFMFRTPVPQPPAASIYSIRTPVPQPPAASNYSMYGPIVQTNPGYFFTPDWAQHRVKCSYCYQGYSNLSSLKEHVKAVHQNFHISCPLCGRSFRYQSGFSRHKKQKHPEAEFQTYKKQPPTPDMSKQNRRK